MMWTCESNTFLVMSCALFLAFFLKNPVFSDSVSVVMKEYCVIGAGPAGLQMGYFLNTTGRDYVLFERANISGWFFTIYPRHRRLISINKRNTGKNNKEFNKRHDWNSLLSDDDNLLFSHYSKDFFPMADDLVRYLNDYQRKMGIRVQYNTNIRNVRRVRNYFSMEDQAHNIYHCRVVIVASGMWRPNAPSFPGSEHVLGYDDVTVDPQMFEGKNVLILGRGNSAFETADSIYGRTNMIHMIGRSRARLSWNTHYVGDLRAINNGLLDTYQLKSLDGLLEAPVEDMVLERRHDKLYIEFPWDSPVANCSTRLVGSAGVVSSRVLRLLPGERNLDNFSLREGYDYVIRCLGFQFDDSLFHYSMKIDRSKKKVKYPAIKHNYESQTTPHLFFVGTVTHSLDFRKSAGGFIHGFRYTARVLHHILEYRYHGVKWPGKRHRVTTELLDVVVRRINEAAGLYQMFGLLCDVIALRENNTYFDHYKEFPVNLLHRFPEMTGHTVEKIIVILLEYGPDFSGPDKDTFRVDRATGDPLEAHRSNFLHPVFYYYERLPTESDMSRKPLKMPLPRPRRVHHVLEDFLTFWTAPQTHILPLRRFLEFAINGDLRHFHADSCHLHAMTTRNVPVDCNSRYLNRGGPLTSAAG